MNEDNKEQVHDEKTQEKVHHEAKHEEHHEKKHDEHNEEPKTHHEHHEKKVNHEHKTHDKPKHHEHHDKPKHHEHHEKKVNHEHHEKKVHHESNHHKKKESCCSSKTNYFAYSTIILGIILIAILISGSNTSIESCTNELNEIKENYPNLANTIDSAITNLDEISTELNQKVEKELPDNKNPSDNYDGDQVKLDFYVMSQCPYGTQVEDAIAPVLKQLGNAVDFNIDFIATDNGNGKFDSLHGQPEVEGNLVQLCAIEYNPNKYMDMLVCMNENAGAIPGNWEKCAQDNGLDVENIKTCYEGDEGKTLHSQSIKKANAVSASGSPTIYLNDVLYNGGRTEADFLRAICQEFDEAPEACSNIPEPVKVDLIVIDDKRCDDCNSAGLIGQLKSIFPGLDVTSYDYNDAQGQKLYNELNLEFLPAFLFTDSVKEGEGYSNVQNYLTKTGDYTSLMAGATFDPKAEICANNKDDNDDGLVDCEDPTCSSVWQCMEKSDKPIVDLFIMSHCPYGTQMEKGVLPVIDALGDSVEWNFRYVYYAMHGELEVTEQHLQYCIQQETPDVFIDYLTCFLEDGETDRCLTANSINRDQYSTCLDESDKEFAITANLEDTDSWLSGTYPLFETDKELNDKYAVQGSPTLVVNGVKVDGAGRDPASILDTVCQGFKDMPEECNVELPSVGYSAGFGFTVEDQDSNAAAAAACGV